jgi:hypothetical protein
MDERSAQGQDGVGPTGLEPMDGPELEYFTLARLERFAGLLADPRVREVPVWHRLVRHAVAAAYLDCRALSLQDEASVIIEEAFAQRT